MDDNPSEILRAVDQDGATINIHKCETSWAWQYFSCKRKEYSYGWACSASEAILKSEKLLKPDSLGNYPAFIEVLVGS